MKRYLVFIGDVSCACGGFDDFAGDYDNEVEAIKKAKTIGDDEYQWAHVYDTKERKEIIAI